LQGLAARATQGDLSALPELRKILDGNPEVWRASGDLAAAERAWIALAAGKDLLLGETLARQLRAFREELTGPEGASKLEAVLIGKAALAYLQSSYFDTLIAGLLQREGIDPARLRLLGQFQDRAANRLRATLQSLAQVRKLLRPAARSPSPVQIASWLDGGGRGFQFPKVEVN
jgi:hypothetical protein